MNPFAVRSRNDVPVPDDLLVLMGDEEAKAGLVDIADAAVFSHAAALLMHSDLATALDLMLTGRAMAEEHRARTTSAIDAIASRLEPDLKSVFLDAVAAARDATDIDRIATLLLSGTIDQAAAAAGIQQLEASLGNLTPILQAGFLGGGDYAARRLADAGIAISFDLVNPRAVAWAEQYAGDLITSIGEETRAGVRTLIAASIEDGISPRDTARRLRDMVGLTVRQQDAVASMARRLHEQGLDPELVERRTNRFAQAQLRYRADTIARTETMAAVNNGQDGLWVEAREQGLLDPNTTKREWVVTDDDLLDERTCEPMAGQQVGLYEEFETPDGERLKVPPAHPRCRCTVRLVL